MPAPREPVRIIYGGRTYNGCYRIEGGCVSVESAYGSRSAAIGRRSPAGIKALAEATLRDLVEAWRPTGAAWPRSRIAAWDEA